MSRDEVEVVVRATLALMRKLAERTRTPADDLMVSILRANEGRLTDAVVALLQEPVQPPSDERVSEALASVGIRA